MRVIIPIRKGMALPGLLFGEDLADCPIFPAKFQEIYVAIMLIAIIFDLRVPNVSCKNGKVGKCNPVGFGFCCSL
jgi:hypothetical protein